MDSATREWAVESLRIIEEAGLLRELENDIAAELRSMGGWPTSDRQRFPHHDREINRLAGIASRILKEPFWKCRDTTAAQLLPTTRQQIALDMIAMYRRRIDGEREAPRDESWLRGRR